MARKERQEKIQLYRSNKKLLILCARQISWYNLSVILQGHTHPQQHCSMCWQLSQSSPAQVSQSFFTWPASNKIHIAVSPSDNKKIHKINIRLSVSLTMFQGKQPFITCVQGTAFGGFMGKRLKEKHMFDVFVDLRSWGPLVQPTLWLQLMVGQSRWNTFVYTSIMAIREMR